MGVVALRPCFRECELCVCTAAAVTEACALAAGGEERARRHLVELFPADGAVLLLAQHPHLGGATVTHRVIALPHREHVDVLAAQHTCALHVFLKGGFHTVRRHWLCVL